MIGKVHKLKIRVRTEYDVKGRKSELRDEEERNDLLTMFGLFFFKRSVLIHRFGGWKLA